MSSKQSALPMMTVLLVLGALIVFPVSAFADEDPELLFVLDISGSMGDQVGGVVKLEAAKNAVHAISPDLSSKGINLGLMHFSGCGSVNYPLPPGPNNSARISQIINGLAPGGGTPLAGALTQAGRRMSGGSGDKRIILLSDGKETCGGDPVAAVSRFVSDKLKFHVIGFDVGSSAVNQLRAIASAGGGEFSRARNAQELKKVFKEMAEDLEKNLLKEMRSCVELGGGNKRSRSSSSAPDPGTGSGTVRTLAEKGYRTTRSLASGLSNLFSVTAAYAQSLPAWVQEPSSEYPSDKYLTAVGSASALSGAKNKAKQGLIEVFSQEIEASETMREVTKEVSTGGKRKVSSKFDLETDIDVESAGELVGAKIEKSKSVFQNGRTTYYALAVLNINQALSSYQDRYEDSVSELDRAYSAAQRAEDPLNKLRYLTSARQHSAEALKYRGYLSVLRSMGGSSSSAGGGVKSRADSFREQMNSSMDEGGASSTSSSGGVSPLPGEIDQELEAVFRNVSISLGEVTLNNICEGTQFDEQMKREISQQFTEIGFRTESGTEGLVVVEGQLSANYTTRARQSDKAIRWNLTLNLKNTQTGRTFTTINENRVTTGLDKANVASRVRYEITEWITDKMNDTITDKLLST